MGIFSAAKGMKALNTIRNGGKARLSYEQVSMMIVNLTDAKKKFDTETFNRIFELYKEFQKCKTTFEVDLNGYYSMAIDVIKKFDEIAPFEKYSGGSELEYSFLMNEIRTMDSESEEDFNEENDIELEKDYAFDYNEEDDDFYSLESDFAVLDKVLMKISIWLEEDLLHNPIESTKPGKKSIEMSRGYLEIALYALVYFVNSTIAKIDFNTLRDWYWESILERNGNNEENAASLMTILEMNGERISSELKEFLDLNEETLTYTRYHIMAAIAFCKFTFNNGYPSGELNYDKKKELAYAKRIENGEHFSDQFTHNVILISDFLDMLRAEI